MKYNGCPYCKSHNVDVTDNEYIAWGNNDQGEMFEDNKCLDCGRTFITKARVEVVSRELDLTVSCPYCQEADEVSVDDKSSPDMTWLYCSNCKRLFGIFTEEYYANHEKLSN